MNNIVEVYRSMLLKYPTERERLEGMLRNSLQEIGIPPDAIDLTVIHAFPTETPSA